MKKKSLKDMSYEERRQVASDRLLARGHIVRLDLAPGEQEVSGPIDAEAFLGRADSCASLLDFPEEPEADGEVDLELVDPEKKFAEVAREFLESAEGASLEIASPAEDAKRPRPDISHLELAVDIDDAGNVTFIPEVGQRVVVERVANILPNKPWLDTNVYTVKAIDTETGALRLWNDELGQWAFSNFMEGLLMGYSFRLPPKKGPVIKRRSRLKKVAQELRDPELQTLEVPEKKSLTPGPKKGRGRPKGSKNRPKDVVRAEKAAKAEAKRAKRAGKKAKKGARR